MKVTLSIEGPHEIGAARQIAAVLARQEGFSDAAIHKLKVVVCEVVTNLVIHAKKARGVTLATDSGSVVVTTTQRDKWVRPTKPPAAKDLEERRRGLQIVEFMAAGNVKYLRRNRKVVVTVTNDG